MLSGFGLCCLGLEDRALDLSPGAEAEFPAILGEVRLEPTLALDMTS